jgi:hypothetical protein
MPEPWKAICIVGTRILVPFRQSRLCYPNCTTHVQGASKLEKAQIQPSLSGAPVSSATPKSNPIKQTTKRINQKMNVLQFEIVFDIFDTRYIIQRSCCQTVGCTFTTYPEPGLWVAPANQSHPSSLLLVGYHSASFRLVGEKVASELPY